MDTEYQNEHQSKPPTTLKCALKYASRGIPVFPCEVGGKRPLTRNGYLDATTDLRRITAWWTRWPEANIAVPTGKTSGFWVLDLDPDKGGLESFTALDLNLGRANVKTGGGGLHYYFTIGDEEVRNSSGRLGPGLDIRGDGGYVLVPPSKTEGAYETLVHGLREAPEKVLKAVRDRDARGHNVTSTSPLPVNLEDVSAIPEGERNDTLARIAGTLHDGTRTLDDLVNDLLRINLNRCIPPLPEEEVRGIARSIHGRGPCTPGPGPGARKRLQEIERAVFDSHWPGMAGKTERDVVVAVIKEARRHSRLLDEGVEVSIDVRSLALAAAISKASLTRKGGALDRLQETGWLRRGQPGRGARAGTFILSTPRAHLTHSSTEIGSTDASGSTLRAPRLRWSSVTREWVAGDYEVVVRLRLGKSAGAVIDVLEREGGSASIAAIARILGVKRPCDLRRRVIARLERRGIVAVRGDLVTLDEDWLAALDREREASGEIAAYERDMVRYNLEREAYRYLRERGQLLTKEERHERARVRGQERREARRAAWAARRRLIRDAERAAPTAMIWGQRRETLERELAEEGVA